MHSNRVTLNIRKIVKKESRQQMRARSQKFALKSPTGSRQKNRQSSSKGLKILAKFRQTSVVTHSDSQSKLNFKPRHNSSAGKDIKSSAKKFPEIYNPSLSSQKHFQLKKYQTKFKPDSATTALIRLRVQSQHTAEKQVQPIRRRQSCSYSKNIAPIQSIKQMSKQKRAQVFKAIRTQFYSLINTSNYMSVKNQDTSFKAYVEKGNNGVLVRQIMARRWWWHVEDDKTKANLVWTQWFDKSVIAGLNSILGEDESYIVGEYKCKKYEDNLKQQAVLKLVDCDTFRKLQRKINLNSNTYFQVPKGSAFSPSQALSQENNLKLITVKPDQVIHNHVQGCLNLHSKKLLFMNFHKFMQQKQWDPFEFIPLSFYIQSRNQATVQSVLSKFQTFQQLKQADKDLKNIWIIKPGENSNRGCGIKVVSSKQQILNQIKTRLPETNQNRSIIIQKYIQKCFLIHNRKFDIRCYILLTTANGILKGYWYKDGYIRTSSMQYSLQDVENQMIHLTNDAVQKKGQDFGKFQDSNKLGFDYFKLYLKKQGIGSDKFDQAYEQMKLIAYYLIASVGSKIKRKQYTFELFGLDFMLDENLKPILIQANSNPCLSNHGKILGKLIHQLVQNVFMTAIDPIFPPPTQNPQKRRKNQLISKDYFQTNKFQLIYTGHQKRQPLPPKRPDTILQQHIQTQPYKK